MEPVGSFFQGEEEVKPQNVAGREGGREGGRACQ
jgi:hypothetical protein